MKIMSLILSVALLAVGVPADPEGLDMIGASAPQAQERVKVRNVAVFVHEGVELLDFAGPGEVFAAAHTKDGAHAFNVYTVAASAEPIISQGFLSVKPQYTFENAPRPDIVVLPGGRTNIPLQNPKVVEWVKTTSRDAEVMMSVCTGAFLLARAGLLDGKEATTHWGSIERLKQEATKATVLENRRFIDNGKVVTTAGVSAGIDGALHVVARLLGHEEARRTARYMEYLWTPEKNAAPDKSED